MIVAPSLSVIRINIRVAYIRHTEMSRNCNNCRGKSLAYRQFNRNQASVIDEGFRIAKSIKITDDTIEQRIDGLINILTNGFLQAFETKLAAVHRFDLD